ncbi:MAG: TIGR00730 family Rossman fold protein [Patescibacteria group bacterium]
MDPRDIAKELNGELDGIPDAGNAETKVPPVPTPAEPNTPEHHEVMGQVLTQAIQQGKGEVPATPDPLVAKPSELESWRVFKIMSEFVEGFEILRKYGLAASIFGSARTAPADASYIHATELAGRLAKSGFAVITGGSAGIMEAANKGAYEAGGASIGLNIRLSATQSLNNYLTDSMTFEHFFVRKVMLTFASEVYIYFPGGFGTLDEFTEILTLVQTRKIRQIPIVLFGKEYWDPFIKLFEEHLCKEFKTVDEADLALYRVVDSVDEAYDYIIAATKT